jgi:hypothetical protein
MTSLGKARCILTSDWFKEPSLRDFSGPDGIRTPGGPEPSIFRRTGFHCAVISRLQLKNATLRLRHALSIPYSNREVGESGPADQPAVMGENVVLEPRLFTNSTGVFTVVSGDEWGDLEVMHFVVGT